MSIRNIHSTFRLLALAAAMALGTSQAYAHAKLVSSDPAKNASISSPSAITLHFSEALEMKVSSITLTDVDGKPVDLKAVDAPDKKSLSAVPTAPLAPGLYTVSWTSMGDDAHKMKGTFSFTVK
jgi:methionine-rich copper-binding protein CopC